MMTMNRATLVGHAGRNPEMRTLPSGGEVALFSLATNERFKRRDGTEGESTEWHAIVAFGSAAQTVRKLVRRGVAVLIEGRIATRTWTDKSGTEHRTSEILVAGPQARVNVLTKRSRGPGDDDETSGGGAAAGTATAVEPERADAVAADTANGSPEVAENAAASDANAASGKVANSAQETESAGIGTARLGNAGDAKAEEVLAGTGVDEAATAAGALGETGAGSGDAGPSDDPTAPAATDRPDTATVAGSGVSGDDAQASETRGTVAEDARSAGADSQSTSEGAAGVSGSAAVPDDKTGETGDGTGAGSALPTQSGKESSASDGKSRAAADAEQGNSPVGGNSQVDRNA